MSIYIAESIASDCRMFRPRRALSTFSAQLTKTYMAETSCNLLFIDYFCYVYAHQDLFAVLSLHSVGVVAGWKRVCGLLSL